MLRAGQLRELMTPSEAWIAFPDAAGCHRADLGKHGVHEDHSKSNGLALYCPVVDCPGSGRRAFPGVGLGARG